MCAGSLFLFDLPKANVTNPQQPPLFLTLAGIVNQEMTSRLFQVFAGCIRDGFTDIHLLVQSTGGFVGDGVAMHNYLAKLPVSLTTYNVGHVASVAVLIYLAGQRRIAAETAAFMIHRPHNASPGGPADVVSAVADSLRIDEDRCDALLKSNMLSMPSDKWTTYAKNDLTFSAQDAISFGAVHEFGAFAPRAGAPLYNI